MSKKVLIIFLIKGLFISIPVLSLAGMVELPKTGQTTSYVTGDDGDLQVGIEWPSPRFTVTYCNATSPCVDQSSDCDSYASTDVVTDNLTGLMRPRDGSLDETKTWANAISFANDLNLCGYNDWRLPNVNELESLLNAGEANTANWLNGVGFTNVQADLYWSSTSFPDPTDVAWVAKMVDGDIMESGLFENNKNSDNYVWPVRAVTSEPAELWKTGQTASYAIGDDGDFERGVAWPSPRFANNGNGTVTDNLTGLVWLKDANCFGEKAWSFALSDTNNLAEGQCGLTDGSTAGDWHLPNRKELRSLSDYSQYSPALPTDHLFTNVENSYYWSSTTVANNPANTVWIVSMQFPYMKINAKAGGRYTWPVRAGILGDSDLSAVIVDNPDPVPVGDNLTYTVTVTNNGPADATGVTLTDTLPGSVTFVSATLNQGTCTEAGGVVTCNIGDMANGAFETVTIIVTAPDEEGAIFNNATVDCTSNDPDTGNNSATEDTFVYIWVPSSDISVIKSDDPDPAEAWQILTYTITVTNNGPDQAAGVMLTDTPPNEVDFVSANTTRGSCTEAAGTVTCDIGFIPAGDEVVVTIEVEVSDASEIITNTATVATESDDPDVSNNTDTEDTNVELYPSPEPTIEETIDFFDQCVEDGTITGSSGFFWGQIQLNIMRWHLTRARYSIERDYIGAACWRLRSAYRGCDGEGYDWVTGDDVEELAQSIYDLAVSLDCWWTAN